MQLLHFRTICATEVSGYWVTKNSFSLRFAYVEEIIHVRHENNFDSTWILFYCSPPSRTTAKSPVLCSLGSLCLANGSHGCAGGEGTGEVDVFVPTGVTSLQRQHCGFTTHPSGCSGSVSEHVKMQLYDFISQMNNTLCQM